MKDLRIVVPENFKEVGEKVNKHINDIRGTNTDYIIRTDLVRFNNGEGKAVIKDSVRGKDLYILSDVSNGDVSYQFHGRTHYMSPDEHFQDIKRILSAECGHAYRRTLIMPYLYQSRQDKKDSRESLDCALALQELANLRVNEFITCDVHNKGIMNAVPIDAFENIYLTEYLLPELLYNEDKYIDSYDDLLCVAPDEGAMKRTRLYSEIIGNVPIASFYKQRDYSKLGDGMHPVTEHIFLGPQDLTGKCIIVTDDMIASGGSILDTARRLKERNAKKIYLVVTFALFTSGIDKFEEYYNKGYFDRVYATNMAYVPDNFKKCEWFCSVDCSYKLARLISDINYGNSLSSYINGQDDAIEKVKTLRKELKK